jgi:hypothetical protein
LALQVGVHDIKSSISAKACFGLYKHLVALITDAVPNIQIIVYSVIPMAAYLQKNSDSYARHMKAIACWNLQILELNSLLLNLCDLHPNLTFVDHSPTFLVNGNFLLVMSCTLDSKG